MKKSSAWIPISFVISLALWSFAIYDIYDTSAQKDEAIKALKDENQKYAKEWARQQDQYNSLILAGFTKKQANEFVLNGCLEYYVGAVK